MLPKVMYQALPSRVAHRLKRVLPSIRFAAPQHSLVTEEAYRAVVTAIYQESSRAVSLEFELLDGYRLNYRAGQYVTMTFPIGPVFFQRSYSFSSCPSEDRYVVTVQKALGGRVSNYICTQLRVGHHFYIDDPEGEFVLPEVHPNEQRYLMVAGGVGIVPIYSLIKEVLSKNLNGDIQLLYAARNAEQALFLKELERLERRHPGFSLRMQLTRRFDDSHDPYRRLTAEKVISRVADPSSAFIYICGPYGLVRKCSDGFQSLGISDARIKFETFNLPSTSLIAQALKPKPVIFIPGSPLPGKYIRTRQTQVETLLDTARNHGINISQKCSNGSCGSCKVKVKSGMVLADEPNGLSIEQAKSGYVLSCMSYPCEPLVVKLPPGTD